MPGRSAISETSAAVKSALRTLDILELVARHARPMAAHEMAGALGIPVSSLSYLLATLADRGYLERSGRHYRLGPAVARLDPRRAEPTLAEQVAPIVRGLTRQLNETAGFFVRRGTEMEAVASEIGQHALRYTLEVGQRAPLHAFAAGKAILAALPADELDLYFRESERKAYTARTLTDEAALRVAIAAIADGGIARTDGEHTPGIHGTARAVLAGGTLIGAFSIAVPSARFDAEVATRVIAALDRAVAVLAESRAG